MTEKKRKFSCAGSAVLIAAVLFAAAVHGLDVRSAVIQSGDRFLAAGYVLLVVLVTALLIAGAWMMLKSGMKPERSFFITGLFLGVLFMAVMPGLSAPDEVCHYISAYRLSNRLMGKPELDDIRKHIQVRADDYALEDLNVYRDGRTSENYRILGRTVEESTYKTIAEWDAFYPHAEGTVNSNQQDVTTTPVAYLPQAAGISLARVLKLGPLWLLFFGKFLNLLVYLLLTSAAIRKIPAGKELIYGTGLLPMTLSLSSSMSYDTMILGTAFLLTAWFLSLACEPKKVTAADMAVLCVLIAAMGPCKMVYSLLLFLFFLIPADRFRSTGLRILSFAVLAASLAGAIFLVNAGLITSYATASEGAVVQITKQGYTVSELLHRPVFILQMLCQTLVYQGEQMHLGMIGQWLGNLDPVMGVPYFICALFGLGLLALAFKKPGESQKLKVPARLWAGLLILGIVLLTAGAMLIAWTERDSKVIEGLQGRYFLPLLPLFLLIIKNDRIVLTADRNREILYAFVCMDGYALLRLYATACLRL